jgi:ADP-ribose pyrophosphatase YjhB (NUDIX family)
MNYKAIISVGIVLFNQNQVLLVKHGIKASHVTGVYGLPAGRVETNEELSDAIIRETKEETGLTVKKEDLIRINTAFLAEIKRKNGKQTFSFVPFISKNYEGSLISSEETIPEWVDISHLDNLPCLPNIKEIVLLAKKTINL